MDVLFLKQNDAQITTLLLTLGTRDNKSGIIFLVNGLVYCDL